MLQPIGACAEAKGLAGRLKNLASKGRSILVCARHSLNPHVKSTLVSTPQSAASMSASKSSMSVDSKSFKNSRTAPLIVSDTTRRPPDSLLWSHRGQTGSLHFRRCRDADGKSMCEVLAWTDKVRQRGRESFFGRRSGELLAWNRDPFYHFDHFYHFLAIHIFLLKRGHRLWYQGVQQRQGERKPRGR